MNKTKDYLFLILFGIVMYLAGAIVLGGIEYLIDRYIGFDFISVILYYIVSTFLAKRMMKSIDIRNNFVTIYLCILTGIMYFIKSYTSSFILIMLNGYSFIEILNAVPYMLYSNFMSLIDFGSVTADGIFNAIIRLLILVLDVFIMVVGIIECYRITRRE